MQRSSGKKYERSLSLDEPDNVLPPAWARYAEQKKAQRAAEPIVIQFPAPVAEPARKAEEAAFSFTDKEIKKMPQQFRKDFKAGKLTAHVRRKENGVYEIRLQYNGVKIATSAKCLEDAKTKFIEKLNEYLVSGEKKITPKIALTEYMATWLETVRRPSVKEVTYEGYYRTFTNYICPAFDKLPISAIKSFDLQELINRYSNEGKNRTAKKIYQLLAAVFAHAVSDGLLPRSPMEKVVLQRYEVENGVPLSREEEAAFIADLRAAPTVYRQAFAFILYTGIRRSELASVEVVDGWVNLTSAKQRKGFKEKMRRLPVSPMLARVLPLIDLERIRLLKPNKMTHKFKEYFPEHHLHDLRHTFITRAQECQIQRELVSFWAGHTADTSVTSTVYTHFESCPELQQELMKLFDYEL